MEKANQEDPKPTKSEDICNSIKFSDFCSLLGKIESASGALNKLKLFFSKQMKKSLNGQSLYPILRLLLPYVDHERGKYGIKHDLLAKSYVKALHLNKDSEAAKSLLNWKDPSKKNNLEGSKFVVGDFAMILEGVLKVRVRPTSSTITIGEVNKLLDSLAIAESMDEKSSLIRSRILSKFNATEQKWLARIILQDMKIGLKHENVLEAFYPGALQRYNECMSLLTVCNEEGTSAEVSGMKLFTRFSPMLAKGFQQAASGQVAAVEHAMQGQPFLMDVKLDGERIAVHFSADLSGAGKHRFQLFTRRGNDYTEGYEPVGEKVASSITGFDPRAGGKFECILDGEVCAWDSATRTILPFGNNQTVAHVELAKKRNHSASDGGRWEDGLVSWMKFIAFDVVFLNGEGSAGIVAQAMKDCGVYDQYQEQQQELLRLRNAKESGGSSGREEKKEDVGIIEVPTGEITALPLAVRRAILKKIINIIPGRVEVVRSQIVAETDEEERKTAIEDYFNQMTVEGEEGLVVKSLTAPYLLGEKSRATAYWVKMKPEYGNQTADLDLVILGAFKGEGMGFRGEGYSTFLCGVRNDKGGEASFHTVCKVGTGYNFQQLRRLREVLEKVAVPWDATKPPALLSHWRVAKRSDRPHVFIPPEHSVVLQLKCAELVESPSFSAGLTLRFPRVQQIRFDKSPLECMLLSELLVIKDQVRDTTHEALVRENEESEPGSTSKGKGGKSGTGRGKRKIDQISKLDSQFSVGEGGDPVSEVEGGLLQGCTYCVLGVEFVYNGFEDEEVEARNFTREQIIAMIKEKGGTVVASPTLPDCQIISGSKRTFQINNYVDKGFRDVIDFRYIVDCVEKGEKLELSHKYCVGLTAASREKMTS